MRLYTYDEDTPPPSIHIMALRRINNYLEWEPHTTIHKNAAGNVNPLTGEEVKMMRRDARAGYPYGKISKKYKRAITTVMHWVSDVMTREGLGINEGKVGHNFGNTHRRADINGKGTRPDPCECGGRFQGNGYNWKNDGKEYKRWKCTKCKKRIQVLL